MKDITVMKRGIWLPLLLLGISGCEATQVDQIKNSPFALDSTYTNAQRLDHRPLCETTTWNLFTDNRGRDIVEYRCRIQGTTTYFDEKLEVKTAEYKKRYENQVAGYDRDMEAVDELKRLRSNVTYYSTALETFQAGDIGKVLGAVHYSSRNYYQEVVLKIETAESQYDLKEWEAKRQEVAGRIEKSLRTNLSHSEEQLANKLKEQQRLKESRADSLFDFKAEMEASIAEEKRGLIRHAYESLQWSFQADGIPTMIYAGILFATETEVQELPHRHLKKALQVAEDDEVDHYKKYLMAHFKKDQRREYLKYLR